MDVSRRIIYLTGNDGVCRDKTAQIEHIQYDRNTSQYHIKFVGSENTFHYKKENVKIVRNSLADNRSSTVFGYLKEVASLSEIKNDKSENVLVRNYERLGVVNSDSVFSLYLNPQGKKIDSVRESRPIFPFGCNNSQFKAVKNALDNSLSVIQGPPGTGKTQTILNIIANLIINKKTVLVVSNNNSAIENVHEKLSSPKYGLDFLVASLGKVENIIDFLAKQKEDYPSFISDWKQDLDEEAELERICLGFDTLKSLFDYQEKEALYRQELSQIETEYQYFAQSADPISVDQGCRLLKCLSEKVMDVWQEVQSCLNIKQSLPLWFKFKLCFAYGIGPWRFWQLDAHYVIQLCKEIYYRNRIRELKAEIKEKENLKKNFDLDSMCSSSLTYLKHIISKRYQKNEKRKVFSKNEFDRNGEAFFNEYPVILSTTFSSRRCIPYFSPSFLFDYVIMDEASQVDIATGALTLSCARNAVIVGDKKQLPNVVTKQSKELAREISSRYCVGSAHGINPAYDFSEHSFLSSVVALFSDVPQTLLREHYRCHPKIINFCNQKFYDNQLVIMTSDKGESDVISVYCTNEGNHCREHCNQRQVDVISREVLADLPLADKKDVGIIAPYRDQARLIGIALPDIQSDTVHKFQGKEKDVIIISTTDDYITSFADDANLLNVAVSRAKSRLCLVISGNRQSKGTNIGDLISYINYNNFAVTKSRVNSIFDYLYAQYSERRLKYISRHKRVSQYDSENLMYGLLKDVLQDEGFVNFSIIFEHPLKELFNIEQVDLTKEEQSYVLKDWTHVDFLIYNKVTKTPILAIEVDGYKYHRKGSRQAERDAIKNSIFEKFGLRLLRFSTTGSQEREKLLLALEDFKLNGEL